jgi:hypothetical protein
MRLLLLLITFASFLPAESYSIAGTVVQHTSGAPVRHARVSVTPADGPHQEISLLTGNNGQFSFTGLPAGKYWLAAEFRGHRQLFQEQEGFSTLIVTGPNLDSGHILFALNGAASIDGTVVDEAGDPVTNAEVLLFRRAILSGRPMTVLFNSTPTDESGEFHPRDLIPGTYFTAGNTAELLGVAPGNYGIHFNGFRGGQLETSRKIVVNLTSDTAINVDQPSKPNITGTLSLPEGHSPEVTVVLDNVANGQGALSSVAPDGSFQFEAAAGRYELQLADSELYIKTVAVKGASYAHGELDVSDGSNIQISIKAAKGVSKVTGVATKNDHPFGGAMVLLIPREFSHGAYIPRDQSDSDGTFALTAVPPGRYTLLAIEDGRELAYHDPAAIAPYLEEGQVIAVPLNTSQNPGTETKVEVQRQKP